MVVGGIIYTLIMNDNTYYKSCTKCGRPQTFCKGECCGKPQGCGCHEYGPKVCGCIRQVAPKCPYEAVIPSITVDTTESLKDLADCFVHVSDINTTFYIDDKHRILTTWAGPVEYNNYDMAANPLGLRSQFLIDFANERGAYYDKTGAYEVFNFGDNGDEGMSFTMQYDAGTSDNPFPGWYTGHPTELVAGDVFPEVYKRSIYFGDNLEHPVTFTNNATGDVATPQELYEMLLDGADITLDHVPVGTLWLGSTADVAPYVDGVHLTKTYSTVTGADHPYDITGFGGSASIITNTPIGLEYYLPVQLSFSIFRVGGSGGSIYLDAQGLYADENGN